MSTVNAVAAATFVNFIDFLLQWCITRRTNAGADAWLTRHLNFSMDRNGGVPPTQAMNFATAGVVDQRAALLRKRCALRGAPSAIYSSARATPSNAS